MAADVDEEVTAGSVFSVSQVNQTIGAVLSEAFPGAFWVVGEIQGHDRDAVKASQRRWGQVYFELVEKEEGTDTARASVKAVLWGDARRKVLERLEGAGGLKIQDGLQVKFLCVVDFYWPRASLQLKVVDVDPHFTLGDLERARQALLKKLKETGLIERNKALPFPEAPYGIGLVTSDGSAAYHDFVEEIKKSGYGFRILLWDARMQGEETESSVTAGLAALAARPEVEAIALVRGGGSRSDLLWFDKEKIALAVAQCPKPVVTGIGHEIDLSVADLAAHQSCKTPTAAARHFIECLGNFETRVEDGAASLVDLAKERLGEEDRLLEEGLRDVALGARRFVEKNAERLAQAPGRLQAFAQALLKLALERLAGYQKELELKDPRKLLQRGWSLLFSKGRMIKSVKDVEEGDAMEAQVRDGSITGRVMGCHS